MNARKSTKSTSVVATPMADAALAGATHGTQHGYMAGATTKLVVGKVAQTTGRGLLFVGGYLSGFGKNTVVGFRKTAI